MDVLKSFLKAVLVLFGMCVFAMCGAIYCTSRPDPGDFPNSKWVYDGEYTRIELTVNEDHSKNVRIITAKGEEEVEIGFSPPDSLHNDLSY